MMHHAGQLCVQSFLSNSPMRSCFALQVKCLIAVISASWFAAVSFATMLWDSVNINKNKSNVKTTKPGKKTLIGQKE